MWTKADQRLAKLKAVAELKGVTVGEYRSFTGVAVSVKEKPEKFGWKQEIGFGIVLRVEDLVPAVWFRISQDTMYAHPVNRGDTITVSGKVSGVSVDGTMIFLYGTHVEGTPQCGHTSLDKTPEGLYACQECKAPFKVEATNA